MASFLKQGLTQGNIPNKAKFVPRPVVILEKSTFIKTSGSSFVLTYRTGVLFSVQIITNRRLAAWPPPTPHPSPHPPHPPWCKHWEVPAGNTCSGRLLWALQRWSEWEPPPRNRGDTLSGSVAQQTATRMSRLLSWVPPCGSRSKRRWRKVLMSSHSWLPLPYTWNVAFEDQLPRELQE